MIRSLEEPFLFQDAVGRVPGKDLRIDREPALGYRAVPDLVVALPWPLEAATVLFQKPFDFRGIVRHQAALR
jgi:hypothetical protein